MYKILYVADNRILGVGGGAIEQRKTYDALKYYAKKNNAELKVISLDENLQESMGEKVRKSRWADLAARLCLHSTYMFFVWRKNRKTIFKYNPDVVLLARSRFGFAAKDIKRYLGECVVISNIENVELDYVTAYFSSKSGLAKVLFSILEKIVVYHDESLSVKYSDKLLFLTHCNIQRIREVYGNKKQNEVRIPICIENATELTQESSYKTVAFIGSLNYDANLVSLVWFIEQVWNKHYAQRNDMLFIIAGRNASAKLFKVIEGIKNIKLYNNFQDLASIIPEDSLILAPIIIGAGMKVKVAETLAMGLPIAASNEALIGYEDVLKADSDVNGIMTANTPEEYKVCIDRFMQMDKRDLYRIKQNHLRLYKQFYTYNNSRKILGEVLDQVLLSK